jgi:hypothetical protein
VSAQTDRIVWTSRLELAAEDLADASDSLRRLLSTWPDGVNEDEKSRLVDLEDDINRCIHKLNRLHTDQHIVMGRAA